MSRLKKGQFTIKPADMVLVRSLLLVIRPFDLKSVDKTCSKSFPNLLDEEMDGNLELIWNNIIILKEITNINEQKYSVGNICRRMLLGRRRSL